MTSIKQAVANAMEFAAGVLDTRDLQLEEIESGDMEGMPVWLITLSLSRPKLSPSGMVLPSSGERDYKVFTVGKENGEVLAMKIRELAGYSA